MYFTLDRLLSGLEEAGGGAALQLACLSFAPPVTFESLVMSCSGWFFVVGPSAFRVSGQ